MWHGPAPSAPISTRRRTALRSVEDRPTSEPDEPACALLAHLPVPRVRRPDTRITSHLDEPSPGFGLPIA